MEQDDRKRDRWGRFAKEPRPALSDTPVVTNEAVHDYLLSVGYETDRKDNARASRKLVQAAGRDMVFASLIRDSIREAFPCNWYKPGVLRQPGDGDIERLLQVFIGDTHFGAQLSPNECPIEYGPEAEARGLACVAVETADYKRRYRKKTRLMAHLLGDLFHGSLHDARDVRAEAKQFVSTLRYLLSVVLFWSKEFPAGVEVWCTPGNHGRNLAIHEQRAISQKWNAIETQVYCALAEAIAVSGATNVRVIIPETAFYSFPIFGFRGFAAHGDGVMSPGNPGKALNSERLYQQAMHWNQSKEYGGPFSLFVEAHMHFGSELELPGRITNITNGCIIPPDPYTLSLNRPRTTRLQYAVESTRGYAAGDRRPIYTDDAVNHPELDTIVQPFNGRLDRIAV